VIQQSGKEGRGKEENGDIGSPSFSPKYGNLDHDLFPENRDEDKRRIALEN